MGKEYGMTNCGHLIKEFTLENGKSRVKIIEYGARITEWVYKTTENCEIDIATGYDTLAGKNLFLTMVLVSCQKNVKEVLENLQNMSRIRIIKAV